MGDSATRGAGELHDLAVRVATEAAGLALTMRAEGVEIADRKSSQVDIVTRADQAVEAYIRQALADARPHDGFLGEESDASCSGSGITWVVDPIDGTVNYAYGIPAWAVSIAAVEGEDPRTWTGVAGAVVNPAAGQTWSALRGGGAVCNARPLRIDGHVELNRTLLGTGFAYQAQRRLEQGAIVAQLLGTVRDIRRAGAASLDICSVAGGQLDAYFETGLQPWDFAGGQVIALEAGAHVSGLGGEPAGTPFFMACHPSVAGPLEEALLAAGAAPV